MWKGDHELLIELISVHKYLECGCIILLHSHPSSLCIFFFNYYYYYFKKITPFLVICPFLFSSIPSFSPYTSHVILALGGFPCLALLKSICGRRGWSCAVVVLTGAVGNSILSVFRAPCSRVFYPSHK